MTGFMQSRVGKLVLVLVGLVSVGLAVLGAILPGLPTTPFVLVALWAFGHSSPRLNAWMRRLPLLKHALEEADRFNERRALRLSIKVAALSMAWASFAVTAYLSGFALNVPLIAVGTAAIAATIFVMWIPTDREPR